MGKPLFQDVPEDRRALMLSDNAESIEDIGYMKPFTEEEILSMKDDLADVSIDINEIEIQKKEIAAEFKHKLEPLTEQKKEILSKIKNKAEFVREQCFKFIDYENQIVSYYNSKGLEIETRRMRPDEKQLKIFPIGKTGTNN